MLSNILKWRQIKLRSLRAESTKCIFFGVMPTEPIAVAVMPQLCNPSLRNGVEVNTGIAGRFGLSPVCRVRSGIDHAQIRPAAIQSVAINVVDDHAVTSTQAKNVAMKQRPDRLLGFMRGRNSVVTGRETPSPVKHYRQISRIDNRLGAKRSVAVSEDDERSIPFNSDIVDLALSLSRRVGVGSKPIEMARPASLALLLDALTAVKAKASVVDILTGHGIDLLIGLMKCRAGGVHSTARHTHFSSELSHIPRFLTAE